MTDAEAVKIIEGFVNETFEEVRPFLPIKTGNLRNNAYKIAKTKNGWRVIVDLRVAPYADYLDGKPRTKGWWDDTAFEKFYQILNSKLENYFGGKND